MALLETRGNSISFGRYVNSIRSLFGKSFMFEYIGKRKKYS